MIALTLIILFLAWFFIHTSYKSILRQSEASFIKLSHRRLDGTAGSTMDYEDMLLELASKLKHAPAFQENWDAWHELRMRVTRAVDCYFNARYK